jgi:hypothetical protein
MPYFETAVFKTELEAADLLEAHPHDATIYSIANTVFPTPKRIGTEPLEMRVQQNLDAHFGVLRQDLEKG